jgi:hypothetical protein
MLHCPHQVLWSDDVTDERKGSGKVPDHVSYLLRLWRERGEQMTWWRVSLQDPLSGQRVGFAHLDELVAFLREQIGLAPPAEDLVKAERTLKTDFPSKEGGSE